ncbi:MAG: hypothetical protein NTV88_05830 [Candidatus Micrarchaeota archaeon]|nr:hypothetical protein [Candidatus Micrarchaeota archaeon]
MENTKQKSGIPGLDSMLGGGIPRGSVVTVAGGTGSGRTIFVSQFLVKGAIDSNEPGLFLSFDQQKDSIYSNLSQFGWDLTALERAQKLVFIEYPANELSAFAEQEGALRDLIETLGIKRIVIDSITPYSVLFQSDEERRMNVLKLVNAVKSWKATCMISAEDKPGSQPDALPHTISGVESFSDGFVHLSYLRRENKRVRAVEVIKMRGSHHEHELREAHITDKGFAIGAAGEEKPKKAKKIVLDE